MKKQFEIINRNTATAFVAAQKTEFRMQQNALPEDERTPFSYDELQKIIYGPESTLVTKITPNHGGNIFAAANHIAMVEKGTVKAREEGAAVEVAKANAAASTALGTAGKTALPENLTPAEKLAVEVQRQADEIAPDDPPFEISTQ